MYWKINFWMISDELCKKEKKIRFFYLRFYIEKYLWMKRIHKNRQSFLWYAPLNGANSGFSPCKTAWKFHHSGIWTATGQKKKHKEQNLSALIIFYMKQFETLRYNIIYWAVYGPVEWRVHIASPISVHSFSVSEWHESKQTHAKSIITFHQIIQFIYLLIKYNESTQTYTQTHNRFTEQVHRQNEWQRYRKEYAMKTIQPTIWCFLYAFWCCMHTIFCSLCFVVDFFSLCRSALGILFAAFFHVWK